MSTFSDETAPPRLTARERRTAVVAAAAGTAIEYFDWMIYATFAVYFAPQMFNTTDTTSALLQSAAVFATGYLIRPLGAVIFGKIGDRYGRRPALSLSVGLITAGTLLLALAPTYAQVGLLASVVLLVARILQGLAYGGEFGTVAATLREIAPPGRRGRFSSVFISAAIGGQLVGFLLLLLLQTILTKEQLTAFGWRIPFAVALLGALVVVYLRRRMAETPAFVHAARQAAATGTEARRGSLRELFGPGNRAGVVLVFLAIALTVPTMLTFTSYVQKVGIVSLGIDPRQVSYAMLVVLTLFAGTAYLWGALGDRVGPSTLICIGYAGTAALIMPAYLLMTSARTAVAIAVGASAVILFVSMSGAVQQTVFAGAFPPHLRALGVGLAHSTALAVFGGTNELVALSFKAAGNEAGHFWLLTVMAVGGTIAALLLRRRSGAAEAATAAAPADVATARSAGETVGG